MIFEEPPFNSEQPSGEDEPKVSPPSGDLFGKVDWHFDASLVGEKRTALVEQLKIGESYREMASEYHQLAEQAIDAQDPEQRPRSQIMLSVDMASLWLSAGKLQECLDELASATEYAERMGYVELADEIYDKIDALQPK